MRPGPGTCDRGGEHPRPASNPIRGLWYATAPALVLWAIAAVVGWQLWIHLPAWLTTGVVA